MRSVLLGFLLLLGACASVQLAGADITSVDQEAVRAAFTASGFRTSQIHDRTLSGKDAARYLREHGVKLAEKRQYTVKVVDYMADRSNAQGRISIAEASEDVWKPQQKARIDHVSGSAHWGDGRLQVEAWCLNYERDSVDPTCATELLSHLVQSTCGAGRPE